MKLVIYSVLIAFLGFISYRVAAIIYYFKVLRSMLLDQNLEDFKQVLGVGYQFRYTSNGIRRYKWRKGWYIIRASFNDIGNLIPSGKNEIGLFNVLAEFTVPSTSLSNIEQSKELIA